MDNFYDEVLGMGNVPSPQDEDLVNVPVPAQSLAQVQYIPSCNIRLTQKIIPSLLVACEALLEEENKWYQPLGTYGVKGMTGDSLCPVQWQGALQNYTSLIAVPVKALFNAMVLYCVPVNGMYFTILPTVLYAHCYIIGTAGTTVSDGKESIILVEVHE